MRPGPASVANAVLMSKATSGPLGQAAFRQTEHGSSRWSMAKNGTCFPVVAAAADRLRTQAGPLAERLAWGGRGLLTSRLVNGFERATDGKATTWRSSNKVPATAFSKDHTARESGCDLASKGKPSSGNGLKRRGAFPDQDGSSTPPRVAETIARQAELRYPTGTHSEPVRLGTTSCRRVFRAASNPIAIGGEDSRGRAHKPTSTSTDTHTASPAVKDAVAIYCA